MNNKDVTMVKRAKTFEELCKNRINWVSASEDNGFNEGILKLLTDLYPDKAHFVYELLQNAEDAKATRVAFSLYQDRLEFVHDGTRLFNLEDIDSITSIANTTKTTDSHSIGKFGVGFKAVFSYTQTPKIYSGKFNFEIKNLVVPYSISPLENMDTYKTYFVFPFNNPKKNKDIAYLEIEKGLCNLKPETLLFLNNIQEISYELNGRCYKIFKVEDEYVVFLYQNNEEKPISKYLRFVKNDIDVKTNAGIMKKLSVALAYKLEENKEKKLKIVPINASEHNVCIYFPAEKENSRLRFLINAPFDPEVSRASIRNTEDNCLLIKEIVNLQIETMQYLRDNGYLTTEFLGVLPSSKDNLSEMYQVFHDELVNLFKTENYTPTISGDFCPANWLYKGGAMYRNGPHISEFIKDEELKGLLNIKDSPTSLWVKNAQQINSDADNFIQDLQIKSFGTKELIKWMDDLDDICRDRWDNFIKNKKISDLTKLYRMLSNEFEINYYIPSLESIKLFHCVDGNMYCCEDGVYILPDKIKIPNDILKQYHFIDKESFGIGSIKKDIEELFKAHFNIEEFSQKSICIETLKKYEEDDLTLDDIPLSEHQKDIKVLLSVYEEYPDICDELEEKSFILSDDNEYVSPEKVYLDERFGNSHHLLGYVNDILDLSKISIEYKKILKGKELENLTKILETQGARKLLWYEKQSCKRNPKFWETLHSGFSQTYTGIDEDYDIYKLDGIISKKDELPKISKLIWMSILQPDLKYHITARYKANQMDTLKSCPAKYIQTLTKNKWILDKNGNLQKPQDVVFEDLPDGWKRPDEWFEHPILKAIEFGKNNQKQREEQRQKNSYAQSLGFKDAEQAKEFAQLAQEADKKGIDVNDMLTKALSKQEKSEKNIILPTSISKNSSYRQEKISSQYSDATVQTYVQKTRSVRVTGSSEKAEAWNYLKSEYTTEDGDMICQLCQKELPFKKRSGEYYFETTQVFDQMNKEDMYQYLALCPNCAAKYKEWVKENESKRKELLETILRRKYKDGEDCVKLDFDICDGKHTLYFTGKHYLDLSTVVEQDIIFEENKSWVSCSDVSVNRGDTVKSKAFGEGIVQATSGDIITVQFEHEEKKIDKKFLSKKIC